MVSPLATYALLVGVGAGVLGAVTAFVLWRQYVYQRVPGGILAVLFALSVTVAFAAYALELAAGGMAAKHLWSDVGTVAETVAPVFLLGYVLAFTGRESVLPEWAEAGLATGALAVAGTVVATGGDHLATAPAEGALPAVVRGTAPAITLAGGFGYLLVLASFWLALRAHLDATEPPAERAALLTAGLLVPLVTGPVALARANPVPTLDLTVLSLVVAAVAVLGTVARDDLFALVPVAREAAIDQLDAGILVVGRRGDVVDANPAAADQLGGPVDHLVGRPATEVLGVFAAAFEREDGAGFHREVVTDDLTGRQVQVTVLPLTEDGAAIGRLVMLRDLTGRKEREAELRRQNERLEEFASVVSHDLRNPLNVVTGRLELARETGDLDHLEGAVRATERMEDLIEDLLALARDGRAVTETEPVSLSGVAEAAWGSVDCGSATLEVAGDRTVPADEGRLQQALENLFHNSLEHGANGRAADDVTVRVGTTEAGFFVEDDGPGIPPADREAVFEYGHTSAESGTGIGLAVVERVVEAHGWSVSVADGAAGGARFEVTGVGEA